MKKAAIFSNGFQTLWAVAKYLKKLGSAFGGYIAAHIATLVFRVYMVYMYITEIVLRAKEVSYYSNLYNTPEHYYSDYVYGQLSQANGALIATIFVGLAILIAIFVTTHIIRIAVLLSQVWGVVKETVFTGAYIAAATFTVAAKDERQFIPAIINACLGIIQANRRNNWIFASLAFISTMFNFIVYEKHMKKAPKEIEAKPVEVQA